MHLCRASGVGSSLAPSTTSWKPRLPAAADASVQPDSRTPAGKKGLGLTHRMLGMLLKMTAVGIQPRAWRTHEHQA